MKRFLILLALGAIVVPVVVFCVSFVVADIPHLINYQGMLTDDLGDPLSGPHNLTFRIYDDTTGGDLEWSETQNGVQVEQGLFNVILGQVTLLDLPFDEQYWLEVQVDSDTMPRLRFTSVGYAYRARVADSAAVAGSGGAGGGWVDDGSVVRLQTITDKVGVGTNSPGDKVEVVDGSMNARLGYHHHFSFPLSYDIYSGVRGTYGGDVEGFLGRRYYSMLGGNSYYGVYGSATTSGKNYGVYGSASDGSTNWAGYFDGDVHASGKVGIGTSSPAEKLHVAGNIKLNFGGDIVFGSNSTRIYESASDLHITADDDLKLEPDDNIYIRKDGASYWVIFDNDNQRLGIGTTSPSQRLEVNGNLKVTGAYTGDIGPHNGAPFPRPAYDSGWQTVSPGATRTLTHNIGGSEDDYVVYLWFWDETIGKHIRYIGGMEMGDYDAWVGAYWSHLTTSQIRITRYSDDIRVDQFRVRIWVIE